MNTTNGLVGASSQPPKVVQVIALPPIVPCARHFPRFRPQSLSPQTNPNPYPRYGSSLVSLLTELGLLLLLARGGLGLRLEVLDHDPAGDGVKGRSLGQVLGHTWQAPHPLQVALELRCLVQSSVGMDKSGRRRFRGSGGHQVGGFLIGDRSRGISRVRGGIQTHEHPPSFQDKRLLQDVEDVEVGVAGAVPQQEGLAPDALGQVSHTTRQLFQEGPPIPLERETAVNSDPDFRSG